MIANLIGILLCLVLAAFLTPVDAWESDDDEEYMGDE